MENRTAGALVAVVAAAGRSALAYDITAGDEERCFLMNPYTGAVSLRRPLDYEVRRRKKNKKGNKNAIKKPICTIRSRTLSQTSGRVRVFA